MAKRITMAAVVIATATFLCGVAGAQVPPFNQCPPVGLDSSCELLIVALPGGGFTVLFDPTQPSFEGGDDTLVGFQNDSLQTVTAFSINSPFIDIFGFDGDGLCGFGLVGCPFGPTGYEGPGVSFNVSSAFAGTVVFNPGIPPGGSAFFSLEENVNTVDVGVCGDGVVQPGEICDDGAANGTAASCCTTSCTGQCNDGNFCTDDFCDSSSGSFLCMQAPHICPDDFNPCTDAECDSTSGCFTVANSNSCDDGNQCTSNDRCQSGFCQGTPNNAPCSDGNACTAGDHCQFGFCQAGTPVNCNDNNPCTSEFCDFFLGCRYTNLDGIQCDDHNPCTTDDVCTAGQCTGAVRNCFDDDPCTVDTCNSAGGAFLCDHEPCTSVPNSNCPAQCSPARCGNGVIDPGETCDPPDATIDPVRLQPRCRRDCTYCGDGRVDVTDGETCDDGNLLSGCTPGRPNIPLDACQNACTGPICHDPSTLKITNGRAAFSMHGRIVPFLPGTSIDPAGKNLVVELTDPAGVVLFRSSLEAGGLQQKGTRYAYVNRAAEDTGGFASVTIRVRNGAAVITARAFGELAGAADHMTTHVFLDAQEWTLAGQWVRTTSGWKLDMRSTYPR